MRYAIVRGVGAPLLRLFGSTPENSYVEVQADTVIACLGRARYELQRSDIVAAGPSIWSQFAGIGWCVAPNTLGLIGAFRGIVELQLARPYRHRVTIVPLRFTRLVVSLEEPQAFLNELAVPLLVI